MCEDKCVCIKEPPGNKGLEGYFLDEIYGYKIHDTKYIKVYKPWGSGGYESCGMVTFKRFFKPCK